MVGLPAAVPGKLPTDTPKGPPGKGIAGWAKANPTLALGSAGIGVVLVVAFVASKTSTSQAATSTNAGIDPSTGLPYASSGQSTYDSSGNDIYNALMGQMGTLQSQITGLSSGSSGTTPPPNATPGYVSYFRNAQDGAIYGQTAAGVDTHLSPADYAALGSPVWTSIGQAPADRYVRNGIDIYAVNPSGGSTHLTPAQYKALGNPKYTQVGN